MNTDPRGTGIEWILRFWYVLHLKAKSFVKHAKTLKEGFKGVLPYGL